LFKIATHGVSLWHFHVYMYYILNWFLLSYLKHNQMELLEKYEKE
jgi:hypothetical protein